MTNPWPSARLREQRDELDRQLRDAREEIDRLKRRLNNVQETLLATERNRCDYDCSICRERNEDD